MSISLEGPKPLQRAAALYTLASLGRRDEHNSASYGLNEEEQEMIDLMHEFAEQKVAPRAAEIDQTGQFPWDLKVTLPNFVMNMCDCNPTL